MSEDLISSILLIIVVLLPICAILAILRQIKMQRAIEKRMEESLSKENNEKA